ncbi:MAG: TRAP transporter large permease [Alphaproteobacteria bacterium]|nr:TRAP transporter large permease [Alphaproteobacteria bacterium]
MSGFAVAAIGFGAMLVLIAVRMPVGLSMLVVGGLGYIQLSGWSPFLAYMKTNPYHQFANYTLSVIPLFILMGSFAEQSGMARDLFNAARGLVGHIRGGLALAVLGACTVFGAISGSSVATTATFGRAALPELRRYGYDPGFSTAMIAIGGVVDLLIPPSIVLVVYAIATEQNIAKLFMAAMIPGLLAVGFYALVILFVARRSPNIAPIQDRTTTGERVRYLLLTWPAILVLGLVIGGIYGGVFTPTEAAAVGTVAMLVIGLLQRRLGLRQVALAMKRTAQTSAMIFIILLGAEVFDAFLALSRLPAMAAEMVGNSGLPPYAIMALLMLFYIMLGAVMDELAMILLTLPVFFPVVQGLDFGMPVEDVGIWFGILVLMVVGVGLVAPPIGLNVFVVSAIAKDVPIHLIYRGVLPFVAADIVRIGLLIAFPGIALWLMRTLS